MPWTGDPQTKIRPYGVRSRGVPATTMGVGPLLDHYSWPYDHDRDNVMITVARCAATTCTNAVSAYTVIMVKVTVYVFGSASRRFAPP